MKTQTNFQPSYLKYILCLVPDYSISSQMHPRLTLGKSEVSEGRFSMCAFSTKMPFLDPLNQLR